MSSITVLIFLGIMMLGVWVMSGIVVLSYTKFQSVVKYIHSVLVFPLVVGSVWLGVHLSAWVISLFINSELSKVLYIILVIVSVIIIVPALLAGVFYAWLRLIRFLDEQYARY
jgi:hypothetical protein